MITISLCLIAIYAAEANTNKVKDFVEKASSGNLFEIESSKLALTKSTNADVKNFAQSMVDDHAIVGTDLESTISAAGVDKSFVRKTMDKQHMKLYDKLQKTSAQNFDKEYVKLQIDAHKDTVKLFKDYSENGDDPTLKEFATRNLPTLEQHEQRIKEIKDAM